LVGSRVYGIGGYSVVPNKIQFCFNLETGKAEDINVDFANTGGYDTSLHFCCHAKELWTINSGHFYSYSLKS